MSHDLFTDILSQLEARVVKIAVTELRENTFYALITVAVDGTEIEIDSRPSDAIALAVRAEAPIFAAESVIEESAIEFEHEDVNEEEVVEEFKKFLDEVKPEDFGATRLRAELALREREQAREELAEAGLGERAGVLAGERVEQALLAPVVDEVPALRQLVLRAARARARCARSRRRGRRGRLGDALRAALGRRDRARGRSAAWLQG